MVAVVVVAVIVYGIVTVGNCAYIGCVCTAGVAAVCGDVTGAGVCYDVVGGTCDAGVVADVDTVYVVVDAGGGVVCL